MTSNVIKPLGETEEVQSDDVISADRSLIGVPSKGTNGLQSDDIAASTAVPFKGNTGIQSEVSLTIKPTSIPVAIVNLVKSQLGAGMLSLPWAFSLATFIPACVGLLFTVVYSFITCMFIINACEVTKTFEYSALLKYVHPGWETTAAFILIYVTYSSCLSYVILIGDFFTDGIHGLHHSFAFKFDREIYIVIVTCCTLLPLSLLKEFKSLKASSIIGNFSNLYCVFLAIGYTVYVTFFQKSHSVNGDFSWNDWDFNILIVINMGAKAYASQYAVPPMYEQLKDRTVGKMRVVTFCAFCISSCIYFSFAFCGYYLYGNDTEGDVLLNYPSTNVLFIVARFAMGISIIGCYPLIFKALFQCVEDKFFSYEKGAKYNFVENPKVRVLTISFIVLSMMVIALFVKDVGPVSSIEGAVTVLGLMCVFPLLVAWKIGNAGRLNKRQDDYQIVNVVGQVMENSDDEKKLNKREYNVAYLGTLLFLGVVLGVAGIVLQLVLLG